VAGGLAHLGALTDRTALDWRGWGSGARSQGRRLSRMHNRAGTPLPYRETAPNPNYAYAADCIALGPLRTACCGTRPGVKGQGSDRLDPAAAAISARWNGGGACAVRLGINPRGRVGRHSGRGTADADRGTGGTVVIN